MSFFASRQFLIFRANISPRSLNRMIETLGTKIKENFGKSKRPTPPTSHLKELPPAGVPSHAEAGAVHGHVVVGGQSAAV